MPYDPYLPYVFDGEETLTGTRLWTAGYDLYMPDRDILYHIYEEHRKRPLFWNDNFNAKKRDNERKAQHRILNIMDVMDTFKVNPIEFDNRDIDKYGMGKQRTLEQFWKFGEFDLQTRKGVDLCPKLEKNMLKRVPIQSQLTNQTS